MCGSDICLGIIAIIFPPIAVWVKRGICSADSLINIALCLLGFLPGLLHAWYIIAVTPEPTYSELQQQDPERGNVTYYYVQAQPHYGQQGAGGYGTVGGSAPNRQAPKPVGQAPQQGGNSAAAGGAGASGEVQPPPSYQQAVGADNKVQHP